MDDIFLFTSNLGKAKEFQNFFYAVSKNIKTLKDPPLSEKVFLEPQEDADSFLANGLVKILSALKGLCELHNQGSRIRNIGSILVDDSGLCVPALNDLPGVHSATFGGLPRSDQKNNEKLIEKIQTSSQSFLRFGEKRLPAFFVCFLFLLDFDEQEDGPHFFNREDSFSEFFLNSIDIEKSSNLVTRELINLEKYLLNSVDLSKPQGHVLQHKVSLKKLFEETNVTLGKDLELFKNLYLTISLGFSTGEVSEKIQNGPYGHGYDPIFYGKDHLEKSFSSLIPEEKIKVSHRGAALGCFT